MLIIRVSAEFLQLLECQLKLAAIDERIFEGEHRVLKVGLLLVVVDEDFERAQDVTQFLLRRCHSLIDIVAGSVVLSSSQRETIQVYVDLVL